MNSFHTCVEANDTALAPTRRLYLHKSNAANERLAAVPQTVNLWFSNLNWSEAEQEYSRGPLDSSVDTLKQTALKRIEDYKDTWNL